MKNINTRFNGRTSPEDKIQHILDQEPSESYINKYAEYVNTASKAKPSTRLLVIKDAQRLRNIIGIPEDKWTLEIITQAVDAFRSSSSSSEHYLHTSLKHFRRYLLWLQETGISQDLSGTGIQIPYFTSKFDPPSPVTAQDVISEQRIRDYIAAAHTQRDKAFIALTYYGALRIHETANLRWKDIQREPDGSGLIIHTAGKTGIPRDIPVPAICTKLVDEWREELHGHNKHEQDDELVFGIGKMQARRPVTYTGMLAAMRAAVKTAGDDPAQFHPHLLRHSRITHLITHGTPMYAVSMIAGGTTQSPTLQRYIHPSLQDIRKAIEIGE